MYFRLVFPCCFLDQKCSFFKKTFMAFPRGRKLAKSTNTTRFVRSIELSADSDSTGSDYIGILRGEIAHE